MSLNVSVRFFSQVRIGTYQVKRVFMHKQEPKNVL